MSLKLTSWRRSHHGRRRSHYYKRRGHRRLWFQRRDLVSAPGVKDGINSAVSSRKASPAYISSSTPLTSPLTADNRWCVYWVCSLLSTKQRGDNISVTVSQFKNDATIIRAEIPGNKESGLAKNEEGRTSCIPVVPLRVAARPRLPS